MHHVGDRVVARERPWKIRAREELGSGHSVLELEALDGDEPGRLTLVSPPDQVEGLQPEAPALDVRAFDAYSAWLDAHRLLRLTTVHAEGLPSGARWGRVQLSEYQLVPVRRLLARPRPSLLLADDVGLGKTIEAGIAILELMARKRARRILIVTPAGLVEQWHAELLDKFQLDFRVLASASHLGEAQSELPAGLSPWHAFPRVLTSMDFLKKLTVQRRALEQGWDLVVVDEAHAIAQSGTDRNPSATQRTRLGRALRDRSFGLLLLTATPHNGHRHSFLSLIDLVDPAHATFGGADEDRRRRVARAMVRRMKSQITRHDASGREVPHFPPRHVRGIAVSGAPDGYRAVLAKVSTYCSKTARDAGGTDRAELVGFAMQIVKKRALSSRHALEQTVKSRIEALRKEAGREAPPEQAELRDLRADLPLSEQQAERIAQRLIRSALPTEDRRRRAELRKLNEIARLLSQVPQGDPKIDALLRELRDVIGSAPDEKVIVFTEYLDTLESLKVAFDADPALKGRWTVLQGGLSPRQRRARQEDFERSDVRVLLATDAASEGLNLQRRCRRVIHFELPWNPNRLEQRNGRVDRYGQEREPEIRYLFHPESPEEDVLHRLAEKIEAMTASRVSTPDILGIMAGMEELEAGLVLLDPEAADVAQRSTSLVRIFEDRALDFEQTMRPLLTLSTAEDATADAPAASLLSADPLLPDDRELEQIAKRLLGSEAFQATQQADVWRLTVPWRWRGPGVAAVYKEATFLRSVAVDSPGVEFITPFHPLGRALAHDAHRRLVHAQGDAPALLPRRLAIRRAPPGQPPALVFTFLGSLSDGQGVVEEPVLGVRVSLDGTIVESADDDLMSAATAGGVPPVQSVVMALASVYEGLRQRAGDAARRRLLNRAATLRGAREATGRQLREELARDLEDRLIEIETEARRRRGEVEEHTGQALLIPIDADARQRGPETALRAARQVAEDREEQIAAFESVADPDPPRPLGVLVLAPEGWPA